MHWRYRDVVELPRSVYDVLVELLNAELGPLTDDDETEIHGSDRHI